jgi:hypothetical protein
VMDFHVDRTQHEPTMNDRACGSLVPYVVSYLCDTWGLLDHS